MGGLREHEAEQARGGEDAAQERCRVHGWVEKRKTVVEWNGLPGPGRRMVEGKPG